MLAAKMMHYNAARIFRDSMLKPLKTYLILAESLGGEGRGGEMLASFRNDDEGKCEINLVNVTIYLQLLSYKRMALISSVLWKLEVMLAASCTKIIFFVFLI